MAKEIGENCVVSVLRRWPLTTACLVLIWILCFFTPPSTPLDNVSMIDKWTHVVMYAGTVGMFFLEYWRSVGKGRHRLRSSTLLIIGFCIPLAMGGLIEILQAYCTGGRRSGEWADWLADAIGVLIGFVIGKFVLPKFFCGVPKTERSEV